MTLEITDNALLLKTLQDLEMGNKKVVVGVDGCFRAGKSTLSYFLGYSFFVPVINIDQFIFRENNQYSDHIRPELKELIEFYQNNQRTFVIEGTCLLNILEKINLSTDIFIYVKALKMGKWDNADTCDHANPENIIRNIENESYPLAVEVAKYHLKYKPLDKASLIYLRTIDGE